MTTKEAKLVKPDNTLKEKVGSGGFNPEDIKRAQTAIDDNEVDFAPIAMELIEDLGVRLKEHSSRKSYKEFVMSPILQLKSQGTFFKYSSITQLSKIIIKFLEKIDTIDNDAVKIIASYHKSLKIFVSSQIKDPNNPVYGSLETELKAVCARYIKKHTTTA